MDIDEIIITPSEATKVRDVYRETLCALLGISMDCKDDELVASASELGKKIRGESNE